MAVAVLHARTRSPVHFPEVDIVAEPQHEVRIGCGNRVEDAVAAAIGRAGPVILGLVDVAAGSDRQGEGRGVEAVLPPRLGLEPEDVRIKAFRGGLTVQDDFVGVGGPGFEAAEVERGGVR